MKTKEKILVVDDNGGYRQLMEIFLSRKYSVKTAENGQETLNLLNEGYIPDLIVSDYNMPYVDGKKLIMQMKSSNAYGQIPVIIISNIEDNATRLDLFESGARDFIAKPFSLKELELRIDNLLKYKS